MLFLAYPVEPNGYVVHSKYCRKRPHNWKQAVLTERIFCAFLEGHLSALHSRLAKESRIFRKPFKIIVSSTVKKNVSKFDRSLPILPHLMFSNERSNVTL